MWCIAQAEVTNGTAKTLTILGYAHEPYLRVDKAGVAFNVYSPTRRSRAIPQLSY